MEISKNSRVWIYQSNRELSAAEAAQVQGILDGFTSQWQAHGHQLAARAEVRYNRFLILMVDERIAGATGCSIDKSVNLMKQIGTEFGADLFDRFNIAYREGGEVRSCGRQGFESLIAEGRVDENTVVFNNLVQTLAELEVNWEVPLRDSWHKQVFGSLLPA